jgi:predicted dehydrogenase
MSQTTLPNSPDDSPDYNRRDFLVSGSAAALMAMLGAGCGNSAPPGSVQALAKTNDVAAGDYVPPALRTKVAVIGLGSWGRELLHVLARIPHATIAAICDNYPGALRRSTEAAPDAAQTADYKTILENKEIKAVIVATPTHQHKDIVLAALKAGKHVYCEAPLANTIEDAREIALAAKAAPKQQLFQSGLQFRADPQRLFLLPFIRSGALGKFIMARAQWHKKTSWRAAAPTPERAKALNWRLYKETSLGLVGELGIHQLDQASWFLNSRPRAVTGFSSLILWNGDKDNDDRDVPDTVQAVIEYAGGVRLDYDATLANSFDGAYEIFYGSDAAVMLRDIKAWMFKEVDSPLLGWEVYASKETFYKETGISLRAGASKSAQGAEPTPEQLFKMAPIFTALENFILNTDDMNTAIENAVTSYGNDPETIADAAAKAPKRTVAGYLEGYQATVTAIKANEAAVTGKRVELPRELYELS